MACVRLRAGASTSARYRGSLTTLSSVMDFTSSPLLRRARPERRSVSYLYLHLASVCFSQHRHKRVQSRSAGKVTAFSFARRTLPRTELRPEPEQSLSGIEQGNYMSTIHLHRTTTSTSEQYVTGLTDFGPGR